MQKVEKVVLRVMLAMVPLLLFGCGGRGPVFTVETFKQIEGGMSLTQVQGILGDGQLLSKDEVLEIGGAAFVQLKDSPSRVLTWRKGKTVIAVILEEDKVKNAYAEITPDVFALGGSKAQVSGVIPLM